MLLAKKCQYFQKSKVQKIAFFFKRVNSSFWSKKANYLVYLDFVKIRLAIMPSDFDEKKETFLTKGKKKTFFFKRVKLCCWPKYAKFFFI